MRLASATLARASQGAKVVFLPSSRRHPYFCPGTHFPTMLKFGSRFGMFTSISTSEASKYGSESMSASIAMSLNKDLEEEQKCDGGCDGDDEDDDDKPEAAKAKDVSPGKKAKAKDMERTRASRSLQRLARKARGAEGEALRQALSKYERAVQPEWDGEDGSFLEVQEGRVRLEPSRRHGRSAERKQAAADLEASGLAETRTGPQWSAASKLPWAVARASHAPQPARGVPGGDVRAFLINKMREKRENKAAKAAELERELGGSFSASLSASSDKSQAESFASSSSSMEMISMGAPPMGDIEEWAQASGDFPMPISNELANLCLLVASVATDTQVVAFDDSGEDEDAPDEEEGAKEEAAASLERGSGSGAAEEDDVGDDDESNQMSDEQEKRIEDNGGSKLGLEVVLKFDPEHDDPSGTVAACQAAFKTYCSNHLKLGDACAGPQSRPSPAAFSKCVKDEDCHVYSKSSTGGAASYTMKCNDQNVCAPSYDNMREIKFMASGPSNGAPQTCEALSQGSSKKYVEIGDFNKKNRGHPTTMERNRLQKVVPSKGQKPNSASSAMEFRVKSRWGVCGDLHTKHGNL